MKKNVIYKLDLSFDIPGQVHEAQCECGAGMGPEAHCKHVCAVLYSLCKFSKTGDLKTELTCTERLQTFHHCKKFKGSPKKCQDLQLTVSDNQTGSVIYDPRPKDSANNFDYKSYVRNICIGSGFTDIPLMQLYKPANVHGFAHDHDYLALTPEEQFLKDHHITEISTEDIVAFERATIQQSANKKWVHWRTMRLHSSNFGRICKCTDRTDKEKLAKSFTTVVNLRTAPIKHGQKYEYAAIKTFESQAGVRVAKCGT